MKKMLIGILLLLLAAACSSADPQPTSTQVPPTDTIAPPTTTPLPPTPDVIADWSEYVNAELGYVFKYPAGCSFGPMAADCGENPPEERSAACLCSLDAENPNEVRMQSLLGNAEEGFTLATFYVVHYDIPAFTPPEGEELSSWLISQHHVLPEDMPDEPNLVIDGLPGVRVYYPNFQRVYAAEEIFVIWNGKLITILMTDVDAEEHRELYENILTTLQFSD